MMRADHDAVIFLKEPKTITYFFSRLKWLGSKEIALK
jgi:hypothetical protein